jgi:hypothetical protein
MPQTTTAATTGTWTEEEIRQQPASWIRSLNNIDNLRASIDSFLTPLLRKRSADRPDRRGHVRLYRRYHCAMACKPHREKLHRRPDNRSGHEPDGLLQPCASAAAGFVCPLRQQPGKRRGR